MGVIGPQYDNCKEPERGGKPGQRAWKLRTGNEQEDSGILSTARSETPCGNLPAPSGKAKYSWETDSEPVLWRKGEKYSEQEGEREPETVRLQAVGAR